MSINLEPLVEQVAMGKDLKGRFDVGGQYAGVNLPMARLNEARMNQCDFSDANLEFAEFRKAALRHANFSKADLNHAQFGEADLHSCNLSFANLTDTQFYRADLRNANFFGAYIEWTNFEYAELHGAMNIRTVSGVGENRRNLYAIAYPYTKETKQGLKIKAGCFFGTPKELLKAIEAKYRYQGYELFKADYVATVKALVAWRKSLPAEGDN